MRNLFLVLLSLLVISAVIILEGGTIGILFVPTALMLMFFGVLFSTLFTFKFSEIIYAFKNAFSQKTDTSKINDYKLGISIVKGFSRLSLYWAFTALILGLIFVLSHLSTPAQLGKSIAVVCLSLLYGFSSIAILFIPMENNLQRKLDEVNK